jgi:hypothetical protein
MTVSLSTVNDERTYNGRVFPHIEIMILEYTIFCGNISEASVISTLNTIQFTDNTYYVKKS